MADSRYATWHAAVKACDASIEAWKACAQDDLADGDDRDMARKMVELLTGIRDGTSDLGALLEIVRELALPLPR